MAFSAIYFFKLKLILLSRKQVERSASLLRKSQNALFVRPHYDHGHNMLTMVIICMTKHKTLLFIKK